MARRGYYEIVREQIAATQPDLSRLMTYAQIAETYGERLRAVGIGASSGPQLAASLRTLTARRILHRFEYAGNVTIPANEIEILLGVLEEPRPLAS